MFFQKLIKTILFICLTVLITTNSFAQFSSLMKEAEKVKKETNKINNEAKKVNTNSSGNSRSTGNANSNSTSSTASNASSTANGQNNWYISIQTGAGKEGTKEQPAKEIAAIAAKLKPGDVIHIAEGVYKGKTDMSSDIITVPVSIIGGYSNPV